MDLLSPVRKRGSIVAAPLVKLALDDATMLPLKSKSLNSLKPISPAKSVNLFEIIVYVPVKSPEIITGSCDNRNGTI